MDAMGVQAGAWLLAGLAAISFVLIALLLPEPSPGAHGPEA